MKKLGCLILLSLIVGCESNPYPQEGEIETNPRRATSPPREAIGVIIEPQYNLVEGVPKTIRIPATVPSPGKPMLELVNLPAGATFNKERFELEWTPGYFDGNDSKDPTIKTKDYIVGMYLRSSLGDIKAEYYEMLLTVSDSPQLFEVEGKSRIVGYEGNELVYKFSVENFDYPQGPFSIVSENLPVGAKIIKNPINNNEYEIRFTADFEHVLLSEPDECGSYRVNCKKHNVKLKVYNPAKHEVLKEFQIELRDRRLAPKLVTPKTITQGLDSTFQASAYDLNSDLAPNIYITPETMEFGDFSFEVKRDKEQKSSTINVSWSDIPPSYNGKVKTFSIKACVFDESRGRTNCVKENVDVKIQVKDRKAPVISRRRWPAGLLKYYQFGEKATHSIPINDGDDRKRGVQSVEILPKSMRKYVSWNNGKLNTQFLEEGIHQFSIVAKSEYNMTTAESFVVEVFSKDRSKTLYFTDTTRSEEVKFFKDIVSDVTIMNPTLQKLSFRNLSGRDTLILGTDILIDSSLKKTLHRAINKIPNIIVASPLIKNMPKKFLDELQLDHNISILGRYKDLSLPYDVKDLHFIARDDFERSRYMVKLKGSATKESYNPLIFSVGVDRLGCEDVLDLTDSKEEERLKVGIICDRKYKGRYAILGTEFADILTRKEDQFIARMWLRRMLKTTLDGGN